MGGLVNPREERHKALGINLADLAIALPQKLTEQILLFLDSADTKTMSGLAWGIGVILQQPKQCSTTEAIFLVISDIMDRVLCDRPLGDSYRPDRYAGLCNALSGLSHTTFYPNVASVKDSFPNIKLHLHEVCKRLLYRECELSGRLHLNLIRF
jgi:hypothetical protein